MFVSKYPWTTKKGLSLVLLHSKISSDEGIFLPIELVPAYIGQKSSVVSLFTFNLIVKQDLSIKSDKETL